MSTPVLFVHGTVPTGGLKLMTGNSWVNATGVVGVLMKGPEFSTLGRKLPETELMLIAGGSAPCAAGASARSRTASMIGPNGKPVRKPVTRVATHAYLRPLAMLAMSENPPLIPRQPIWEREPRI